MSCKAANGILSRGYREQHRVFTPKHGRSMYSSSDIAQFGLLYKLLYGVTTFFRMNPTLRLLTSLIMDASHDLKRKRCMPAVHFSAALSFTYIDRAA
jgi:hypothetical protein